jgi:hypothetical protein
MSAAAAAFAESGHGGPTIPSRRPDDLGNMRANGVRSLAVWQYHHEAVLNADRWPDHMPVPGPGVWAAHGPGLLQAVRQLREGLIGCVSEWPLSQLADAENAWAVPFWRAGLATGFSQGNRPVGTERAAVCILANAASWVAVERVFRRRDAWGEAASAPYWPAWMVAAAAALRGLDRSLRDARPAGHRLARQERPRKRDPPGGQGWPPSGPELAASHLPGTPVIGVAFSEKLPMAPRSDS